MAAKAGDNNNGSRKWKPYARKRGESGGESTLGLQPGFRRRSLETGRDSLRHAESTSDHVQALQFRAYTVIDDLVRDSFQISSPFRNLCERWTYNQHYDTKKVFSFYIQFTTSIYLTLGKKNTMQTSQTSAVGFINQAPWRRFQVCRCRQMSFEVKDSPISLVLNDSSRAPPGDEETTKASTRSV